jgi:hypothetical protein
VSGTEDHRGRLIAAGALAAALIAAVVLILVLRDAGERQFAAAPSRCIALWNDDGAALVFGRHQSGSHGYYEVEVMELLSDGSARAEPGAAGARCGVVFASSALDPEPVSAAQIHRPIDWVPLSTVQEFGRLAELQGEAQSDYNARIGLDGRIEAL